MTVAQDAVSAVRSATWSQRLLAAGFVTAGVAHFVRPAGFEEMIPDPLPAHLALVLISGAAEIAGGLGLLAARTRRWAGIGLIVLLVGVFPANVHMALDAQDYGFPEPLLWARLPLQPLFIWWVYRAAVRSERPRGAVRAS